MLLKYKCLALNGYFNKHTVIVSCNLSVKFSKYAKVTSSTFIRLYEIVCYLNHVQLISVVFVNMEQQGVIESFLGHVSTKVCFKTTQHRECSFCSSTVAVVTSIDRYSLTIVVTWSNICCTVSLACDITLIIEEIVIVLSEHSC